MGVAGDDYILEVDGISKRFGGLQALEDVEMRVKRGTVHGIIGPNGAGKTTLFNVITGMTRPDRGSIRFEGRLLSFASPHQLVPLGIARTFQNIRLFRDMTVEDNVLVAQHSRTPTYVLSILLGTSPARLVEAEARRKAREALAFVGLEVKARELARHLPYGQQRLVELARALAAEPRLLLLDEPGAGMNLGEKANLLGLVGELRKRGYTVVLIEHDMRLVMNVCDSITVLDHGRKIAEGSPAAVRNHPDVIRAYLGKGAGAVA